MCPFKKRELKVNYTQQRISEMREGMPVGTEFTYLGMRMAVTDHSEHWPKLGPYPALRADYFDNNGVLHNIKFSYQEYLAIKEKNS
jgi:hypothetical protein